MFSLRSKIMFIVMIFVSVIGTGFVLYSIFTTSTYKQLHIDNIEHNVNSSVEMINKDIKEIERAAIFYAKSALLCKDLGSDKFAENLVVEFLKSFPFVIGGGFWYEPYRYDQKKERVGFYAYYNNESGEAELDKTFIMSKYDYHTATWYREIIDKTISADVVMWTRPYFDDTGSYALMTTAGSIITDKEGKLLAISNVDWDIKDVIDKLMQVKPTTNSFVLLCSPEVGYIITTTHDSFRDVTDLIELPFDIFASDFTLKGKKFRSFKSWLDNGWLMTVNIPENEIFRHVEKQNKNFSIIISVIILALLLLAYYFINEFINKPIEEVTNGVKRLATGDLTTKIYINSKDELGLLSTTFNSMTSQLTESLELIAHERAEKERISAELSIATKIQASMLPFIFPPFPQRHEFDIYASMVPAKEIGGDFYDFYMVDDDTLAFVVADVSGKGIPAALFMVITQTLMKNNVQHQKTPKEVFDLVNNMLCENNEESIFVTAFLGYLQLSTGLLTYVNAGHNPPLIKSKPNAYSDYEFNWLSSNENFILAIIENIDYEEHQIYLQPGDELFLYTDGVTEAMNRDNVLFSEKRLIETLNKNIKLNPKELVLFIKENVDIFTGDEEQTDDITLLSMKYFGPGCNMS